MRVCGHLYVVRDAEHALELCEQWSARDFLFATRCKRGAETAWHALLAQVTKRAPIEVVHGRPCIIDLEPDASEDLKRVVRSIGRALLAAGAVSVTVWGQHIARAA